MGNNSTKDFMEFIRNSLFEVEEETKEKGRNKFYTCTEHYTLWVDFMQSIFQNISEFEKCNSLVVFRLFEMQNTLLWVGCAHVWGRYHSAIRELRYLFESYMQAYYLDMEHSNSDILCKLEILKEIDEEVFGSRLIDGLELKPKSELKKLYKELSKYIHSSYEELRPVIEDGEVDTRITFAFDQKVFDKTEELINRVMDTIYFITLSRFPQIKNTLNRDEIFKSSLKNFNCYLTLNYLVENANSNNSK